MPRIDRLNRYPVGLPDSSQLREILAILFSEDEAFVASRFPFEEASLGELARATGFREAHLSILKEKKRLTPFIVERLKKNVVNLARLGRH